MHLGDRYEKVKKVYSINIIYFPMGKGKDYLYHGITTFTGVHTNDKLEITDYEADTLRMRTPQQVFPEYFIIRVNEFNQVATTPLEEWIEYLKNGKINSDTKAPGLQEARQKLLYMNMSDKEKRIYEHHLADQMIENDILDTARIEGLALGREEGRAEGREEGRAEGREEGRAEGREEGRAEGREEGRVEGRAEGLAEGREKGLAEGLLQVAKSMKQMGLPIETITQATGLPAEEIRKL
jgi:predicted transposase/invertase (TIGR01784 family)